MNFRVATSKSSIKLDGVLLALIYNIDYYK